MGGLIKMKAVAARLTRGMNIGSRLIGADNSGAQIVKIVAVKGGGGGTRRRQRPAKIADRIKVSVKKGPPDMKGEVFDAVIVRQKKPYRRTTGERIAFRDNAVALLKDDKGNPKGTQIKGPISREVADRWPEIGKIARFII